MTTRPLNLFQRAPVSHGHEILMALAFVFMLIGCITLWFSPYPASLTSLHILILFCAWSLAWGATFYTLRKRLQYFDPFILPVVALLTGWGLLLQARLAPSFMLRQVVWLAAGCAVLTLLAGIPQVIRQLKRYRYSLLTAGLLLLSATLVFGVNPSGYGQRLWLGAFGVYVQPSEILKLLLVIYLAAYLTDHRHYLTQQTSGKTPLWLIIIGPMLIMVGLALVLVGWQQDLGAALLFYLTFTAMVYLAWGKLWHVLLSLILFAPVAIAGVIMSSRVALRVSIWLDPWAPEQADRAFQILQSLYALSSGGIVGQGLGLGLPTLIPAVHTDFVYAALAEEFGLFGAIACIALYALLIYRGVHLAQKADTPFASLLAGGISALIAIQVWVIVAGNIKLIPITGVTLPFVSYGGSSLLTVMIATGLLINISSPHSAALSITPEDSSNKLAHSTGQLGKSLLILLFSLIIFTGLWSVLRADELRISTKNPRFVLGEARIQRGTIYDRNETILASNEVDADGYVTRIYPEVASAPVVGYATLEYGTREIEATCNTRLRGELQLTSWDRTLAGLQHKSLVGRDVRLTINAELQALGQSLLGEKTGAIVLADARTGEILALVSSPIYNPNTLQEDWEALVANTTDTPLLNRATQGLAQPGSILQTMVLATALGNDSDLPPVTNVNTPYPIDGMMLSCNRTDVAPNWETVLAADCPGPITALAQSSITVQDFMVSAGQWGLLDAPSLALPTVASEIGNESINLEQELLGQGNLLVTPLQMARIAVTIANNGVTPPLHILMTAQEGCSGFAGNDASVQTIPASTAEKVRNTWHNYGMALGDSGLSIAGEDRSQVWFIGLGPTSTSRYAVAVFIDHENDTKDASDMGVQLLHNATQ